MNSTKQTARVRDLTVKTGVKAGDPPPGTGRTGGDWIVNHNETQAKADLRSAVRTRGLSVKTGVKAGPEQCPQCRGDLINNTNHNETEAAERTRGLSVKTSIKAGPSAACPNCKIKRSEFPS